jgi:hypothetical protein
VRVLRGGCRIVAEFADNDEVPGLLEPAIAVAVKLARHPKCADELRKLGMIEIAKSVGKDPAMKPLARQFYDALRAER